MTNKERLQQNNLDLQECIDLANELTGGSSGGSGGSSGGSSDIELQEKSFDITADGAYEVLPDTGKALSKVTINVDTPDRKAEQSKSLDVTADGTYTVTPDAGKVLSQVTINVDTPDQKVEQSKSLDVTADGTYTVTPDAGKVLSQVTINVDTPDRKAEQEKTLAVSANGSYEVTPDEGKALSKVTVSVNVVSKNDATLVNLIERDATEIVIPAGVTSIGAYAFAGCTACVSYDFSAVTAVPALDATAFDGINAEAKIYVPGALYREWVRADGWKDFEGRIEAVGEIPPLAPSEGLAYSYNSTLGGYICTGRGTCTDSILVIPDTYDDGVNGKAHVVKIGANAFEGDTDLIELVLPESGAVHDSYTFKNCTNLERVENCYAGGKFEGQFAFIQCSKLAHVHFIKNGYISSFMFDGNADPATYDFTDCTEVVTVAGSLYNYLSTGTGTQYLVPAALYDEWCAATNWTAYSHLIKAV